MKTKLLSVFLILIAASLFFACKSEPEPYYVPAPVVEPQPYYPDIITVTETLMPVTVSMLERLFESNDQIQKEIGNYQLILFGRIFLERNYTSSRNTLGGDGIVTFEDRYTREEITINDQTEGQVVRCEITDKEIILYVCFEYEDKYQLKFTSAIWDTDGYFYLNYSPNGRASALGEEKGIITYGDAEYKIKFTGEKSPYLLIKLSQSAVDIINSRVASGRKVLPMP